MKKVALILTVCLILGCFSGCSLVGNLIGNVAGDVVNDVMSSKTKSFTNKYFTFEGPSNMSDSSSQKEFQNFDIAYSNKDIGFIGIREARSDFSNGDTMTLEEYTQLIMQANNMDKTVQSREGKEPYQYFTYEATSEGLNFKYLGCTFETDDAFWFIQIYSLVSDFEQDTFLGYADTVKFQ